MGGREGGGWGGRAHQDHHQGSSHPDQTHPLCPIIRRDAERALAEAAERKAQVTVLMETVETLHAGNASERDQRLVVLTAQLAASRTAEAVLEVRAAELLGEAESRQVGGERRRESEEGGGRGLAGG
jgi:hypothetical protein